MNGSPTRSPQRRHANFDSVARIYRWAEYLLLGPLLTRTREHFLNQASAAEQALVLGDGDGRFLAKLLRQAPHLKATAVDSSGLMLRLLGKRCAFAAPRLHLVHASATDIFPDPQLRQTDLIVTHFFLDCLHQSEVDTLAQTLAAQAAPACLWIVSDFGIPEHQPWRFFAAIYVSALYFAFRVLTGLSPKRLPAIASALGSAGFTRVRRKDRLFGLLYSELWQLNSLTGGAAAIRAQLALTQSHPLTGEQPLERQAIAPKHD